MSKQQLPTTGGDPRADNYTHRWNRHTRRAAADLRITSSRGRIARKRKKYVHIIERAHYRNLLTAVANDLTRSRRATGG